MTHARLLTPPAIEQRARPHGRAAAAFGRRALALLLFGLVWLIPSFSDRRFVAAMLAWDGLVLLAWAIDIRGLPAAERLRVRRTWHGASALSVPASVELTVMNDSDRAIAARVIDAVPPALRAAPPECQFAIGVRSDATATYDVRPRRRGETAIGRAYVRYQSALGLGERWAEADIAQTIVTYPNLEEARRFSLYLIRSRQTELERRSSRMLGAGRAFESLREYRPGDDVRDICWTATARRGRPVTKRYELERSQTVWLVIDSGRLMRARIGGLSKLDHAVNAALAVTQVALNSGDRVGLLAYGRRIVRRLPPGRGVAHLKHAVEQLARIPEDDAEADHLLAAGRLLADQKRRSLVIWLTDLAETAMTPEVVRGASRLLARHVLLFVVIGEPDLDVLAARAPSTVGEMYETAAAQQVAVRRELLLASLRAGGALAVETTAAGLAPAVVNGYLDVKQRNRL